MSNFYTENIKIKRKVFHLNIFGFKEQSINLQVDLIKP